MEKIKSSKSSANTIVKGIFLFVLNLILMSITGYLTIAAGANFNSRIAAILLSFLIPYFIVTKTYYMNGIERMLKFGFGFLVYFVLAVVRSFAVGNLLSFFIEGLIPCVLISLAVLYYGDSIISRD